MTTVEKQACYWLLLLCASFTFQTVHSSVKTCNLYSTTTGSDTECVQHCDRRRRGKEVCSLSCKRNNNGTAYEFCNQVCDPSDGNNRKCSFHCDATKECVQQCTGGHCRHMKCGRGRFYCEQYCTGGGCKNMVCNSFYCFQNCRTGGCNMKCGPHAKYCEQICTGGNCQMTCEAKTCRAYCPTGTCDARGPNTAIQTQCMRSINDKRQCVQTCNANGCYCKADGHTKHCKQACVGETCRAITCHSKTCRQDCGSNCSLTCSADHCVQECTGSGCIFQCSGNVDSCKQICRKGHCEFNCAAKNCKNECEPAGTCTFNEIGDSQHGANLDAKCDYRHNGQCEPQCKECVYGGHDLKCMGENGDKCNQNCLGGLCENIKCSAKVQCYQQCPGGKCGNLDCRSNRCIQRCSGGNCGKMQCTAQNCTQICLGNCGKMVCNSLVCEQYCLLGDCNFECGQNVTSCRQTCYSGQCSFACRGENCHQKCPPGSNCFTTVDGLGVATAVRQYLRIILTMAALSVYITL